MPARYLSLVLLCLASLVGAEPKRDRFGDPLPEGAIARLGSLRLRLESPDLQGAKPARTITIPNKERVSYLSFSSDSQQLLTGGADATFRLWDRNTGAHRHAASQRCAECAGGQAVVTGDARGNSGQSSAPANQTVIARNRKEPNCHDRRTEGSQRRRGAAGHGRRSRTVL